MSTKHKLICPLPTQESCESVNCDNILWDLGKATKRGTKKCPDCGYINGIRCYACKNPLCNRVLKIADKHKPGVHIDAIKLVSGATRQIYSVRVREKGGPINGLYPDHPDQRGFVQLPCAIYESDKLSEVALCFVDNCERSYSILKCHENDEDDEDTNTNKTNKTLNVLNFCAHIEAAVKSLSVAHAFDFKHDLINNLKVCDDMKKKLCSLAKSTEGPLVQRIARNVLAIKCFVNSGNPLGYLHFMLEFKKSVSNASEEELERFHCECSAQGKCLHYYACVCAFASDVKLLHKYSQFIQREFDSCIAYDITTLLEEGLPLKRAKIHKTKKKVKQIKVISDNIIKTSENNDKSTIKPMKG
ncbi:uncharacterized protein C2orf42 homolog isoform X2 [Atheta coriaria]|uniref:uncharacterized protein C2orf42 homolog isoform X2 n=1 Tax=Dalotia coriaria TaxID=877792 RepID=UPI0031F3D07F